ncbi:MAG TPA: PAS domain-containing protein, partial [Candidatus Sulfotelmatobacter sp.]|nr:PAS domain-containing protein [Candidatus Sulfotelmatobacter sp.]
MPARPKGPQRPDRPSPAPEARQVRDLRRRLAATTQRLAEAEQTLEAIRTGAVDAVVVASGPGGEQVYTLQGAERSYRLLVETVNAGALTLALDGLVLYANQQAATLSGVPLEQLLGAALDRFVAPEDLAAFHAMSRAALAGEAAGDVTFLRAGRPVHVHLAFRRL